MKINIDVQGSNDQQNMDCAEEMDGRVQDQSAALRNLERAGKGHELELGCLA